MLVVYACGDGEERSEQETEGYGLLIKFLMSNDYTACHEKLEMRKYTNLLFLGRPENNERCTMFLIACSAGIMGPVMSNHSRLFGN
jgi:hypothetical protein